MLAATFGILQYGEELNLVLQVNLFKWLTWAIHETFIIMLYVTVYQWVYTVLGPIFWAATVPFLGIIRTFEALDTAESNSTFIGLLWKFMRLTPYHYIVVQFYQLLTIPF